MHIDLANLTHGQPAPGWTDPERVGNLDKSSNPLVSVIIPAFNASEHIRQTLESVLAQTYQAIEVIVVDDGSSDATTDIVKEFVKRDTRFQLFRQTNAGVGAARNTAIRKARGKYIAPLDADDVWFPEKLEKQVACMEQYGMETGLVYCWFSLVDAHGDFLGNAHQEGAEGRLRLALLLRNVVGGGSVPLLRATALEKIGLYLTRTEQGGAQGCEDWDLYLRIAEAFSVRVVPEYLVAYRQTSSSMSGQSEKMAASYAVVIHRARERNCDLPFTPFRWSTARFYLHLAYRCLHWGPHVRCPLYLKRALFGDPVLLLSTGFHRACLKTLLKLIMDPSGNLPAEQIRPRPKKTGRAADLISQKRRRPFISNRLLEHIERARWSALLNDGD
jgi:glycosyltransferase involved in cell wall biosynthesis